MYKRFKLLLKKSMVIILSTISGGVLGFLIFLYFAPPIEQMMIESHGLCGFVFGTIFCIGCVISNLVYWLVTGKSVFGIT